MSNITQKRVEALIPFSGNYKRKISASQISREIGIPQQTVSRALNNLVKENVISYYVEGKNKLFYINSNNPLSEILMNIIESSKSINFFLDNPSILLVIKSIKNECEGGIVFGSYSSGKADKKSDLDLVVFSAKNKTKIRKILKQFPMEINVHFTNFSEFRKELKRKNPLTTEIRNNHILFGDIIKIVRVFQNE